ncbi:hypothetical protein LINGRAHAP2_LOCUS8252 [Linum grandiflorum]
MEEPSILINFTGNYKGAAETTVGSFPVNSQTTISPDTRCIHAADFVLILLQFTIKGTSFENSRYYNIE